jgi:membrane associated rhomboid family serine protease
MSAKDNGVYMRKRIPVVATVILVLNIVGYLIETVYGQGVITARFGMYQGALARNEWYRLITSGFLHYGLTHISSNMICLMLFGSSYESAIGSVKFALIYLASLLGAGLIINFFGGNGLHAGASGGVWGLMAAVLVFTLKNHGNPVNILKCIALNLVYSFTSSGVSWQGHIGGGLGGLISAVILLRKPSGHR